MRINHFEKLAKVPDTEKAMGKQHPGFKKEAEPFFGSIMEGLEGEVDGEHFWDAVAENAVFEFMYNAPGSTDKIEGRDAYTDSLAVILANIQ